MASKSERVRDKLRKKKGRKEDHEVLVRRCKNRARRERLEKDDIAWLMWYFAPESGTESPYTYEFTIQQREMTEAIRAAIVFGGDQALAASRGEGKTTLFERMILKYSLAGLVRFSVLFAATGANAIDSLESIKAELECNDRLAEDYPEVCDPVRALEGTPNRAHYQVITGKRHDNGKAYKLESSRFSWCGQEIVFPNVPGSPSAGAIIATRGLDSAVRGLKKRGRRVDVAGIDDPDTEETASSLEQGKKLEKRIERGIGGLGSQKRRVARVILTTLQNRTCQSFSFTDPAQKPSFHGKRFRFLLKPPDRMDLWDQYVELRKTDLQNGTNIAFEFYVDNRDAMDAGAEVANKNRYSQGELSALQFYFNEIVRIGKSSVATEYDNDPPDEDELNPDQLTSGLVRRRINGLGPNEIPSLATKLVSFVDIGERNFNWTDMAWTDGCIGDVIDYGLTDVRAGEFNPNTKTRDPKTLELAILSALHDWRTQLLAKYQGRTIDLALADSGSGLHMKAVYRFCREVGPPFYPSKGMKETWRIPTERVKFGDRWALVRQPPDGTLLYEFDSGHWKKFCHERLLTQTFDENLIRKVGSLALFSCPPQSQFEIDRKRFASQLIGQVWGIKKIGGKPCWMPREGGVDHFQDATSGCCLAANICGVKLVADQVKKQKSLSLSEMREAAKRKAS